MRKYTIMIENNKNIEVTIKSGSKENDMDAIDKYMTENFFPYAYSFVNDKDINDLVIDKIVTLN